MRTDLPLYYRVMLGSAAGAGTFPMQPEGGPVWGAFKGENREAGR